MKINTLRKKIVKQKVEFNEDITFYAFRYALGRMTYAVKDVTEYLIENWDKISNKNEGYNS